MREKEGEDYFSSFEQKQTLVFKIKVLSRERVKERRTSILGVVTFLTLPCLALFFYESGCDKMGGFGAS